MQSIAESAEKIITYFRERIKWEQDAIDLYKTGIYSSNINLADVVSDLRIDKTRIDDNLSIISSALITSTRFDFESKSSLSNKKATKDKIYYLGITKEERTLLLKKIIKDFSDEITNANIIATIIVPIEFIGFSNKELISLEEIL